MPGNLPFEIVFVSGAPRSGTSIAHALICTSARVNNYIGECSYFSQMIRAFDRGMETFDLHTRYYFNNQLEFADFHRSLLVDVLTSHWKKLDRPDILVLKDPDMLPIIPTVAGLIQQAKFVILHRDPLDVIASRIQVQTRGNPHQNFHHPDNVSGLAEEYVGGYRAIEKLDTEEPNRVLYQEYEKLVRQDLANLQKFLGISDISPFSVWENSAVHSKDVENNAWNSALYFKPLSSEAIGAYRKCLNPETTHQIELLCRPTANRLHRLSQSGR